MARILLPSITALFGCNSSLPQEYSCWGDPSEQIQELSLKERFSSRSQMASSMQKLRKQISRSWATASVESFKDLIDDELQHVLRITLGIPHLLFMFLLAASNSSTYSITWQPQTAGKPPGLILPVAEVAVDGAKHFVHALECAGLGTCRHATTSARRGCAGHRCATNVVA